jgi:hypothetical protein
MDAGLSEVPSLTSNSKAPRRRCMGVSPSNLNPGHESYRGKEPGKPQRFPEKVLRVCSCLIFPTLIRRSPTFQCLRSLTGQRQFPRQSPSPTRSRTCCRLSHPSHLGTMFQRSDNGASSAEEIVKPAAERIISGL